MMKDSEPSSVTKYGDEGSRSNLVYNLSRPITMALTTTESPRTMGLLTTDHDKQ
jgi:hypothetical protein